MIRTRRHFIKTVLLGATATGLEPFLAGCPMGTPAASRHLDGESFAHCHAVRDGTVFPVAPVSAEHDVVIVGGGPSGMAAAYRLRDRDVLLLEKEHRFGGNCVLDEWSGVRLSTGGAFYTESEKPLVAFFKELGVQGMKVSGGDSLIVKGEPVRDFFRDGANRLPFAQKVRDDFRRSYDELLKMYKTGKKVELDRIPFAEILKPYSPELTQFWDRFGRSNWGGDAANTSGWVGVEAYTWAGGNTDPRLTFPGGMAGGATAIADAIRPKLGDRMRTGCAIYKVEVDGAGTRARAIVRYIENGQPRSVRARVVIVATPKMFAKRVVAGLPEAQFADMGATRYQPFPVFNVCMNEPGPEPAYDNWFLDTPFTDFIPADWVLHAGKGPAKRKTALTVYHPLPEAERATLLSEESVLHRVDGVVDGLEKHFPGTIAKIAEVRVFRRGHPMFVSSPGRWAIGERSSRPFGPVLFANTDSGPLSTFDGALDAAENAAKTARALLAT